MAQQINRDGCCDQCEDSAVEKDSGGSLVEAIGEEKVGSGGEEDAHE